MQADVTGRCQTKYAVTSSFWGKTSITRNKDLMACTDRHGYSGSLQSMKYQMASVSKDIKHNIQHPQYGKKQTHFGRLTMKTELTK